MTNRMIKLFRKFVMFQHELADCVDRSEKTSKRFKDLTTIHSEKTRMENRKREQEHDESGDD